MKLRVATFFFLSLVLGCAGVAPKRAPAPKKLKALSLIYSGNRYSEIEPCDCVLKKLGGVNREWNITQRWRNATLGNIIYLTGGTSFVPIPKNFEKTEINKYLTRATFLTEALNYLGVLALSPSAEDLALGLDKVKSFVARSVFPYISTNLFSKSTGKPLFQRFLELKHGNLSLIILGASGNPDTTYEIDPDVEVRDPIQSLETAFAELPSKSSLVVLLSSLTETQKDQVLRKFPQINIVLGAAATEPTRFNVRQENRNSLYLNPMAFGRAISILELKMKDPVLAFYNQWTATTVKDRQKIWSERIKDVEKELENKGIPDKERKVLVNKREEMVEYLIRTATVPLKPDFDTIEYQSETVEIDETYDQQENDLDKLLERYRQTEKRIEDQAASGAPIPPTPEVPLVIDPQPEEIVPGVSGSDTDEATEPPALSEPQPKAPASLPTETESTAPERDEATDADQLDGIQPEVYD